MIRNENGVCQCGHTTNNWIMMEYGVLEPYCQSCVQKENEEYENELVFCGDCKTLKPRKEVRSWRWFDFYAAQGDEPMLVCTSCWGAHRHQRRMEQDAIDREREMRFLGMDD